MAGLKKCFLLIIIFFSFALVDSIKAQNEDINILFKKFIDSYSTGDLVKAEDILQSILKSKIPVTEKYKGAIYNNLCAINTMMGRYQIAIDYNNKAENLMKGINQESQEYGDICINKASIYNIEKSYDLAIEYLEKGIRIYKKLNYSNNKQLLQNLSAAYLNLGIAFYEIKNLESASEYFDRSVELKQNYELTGLSLVYLNIAKTYAKTKDTIKAEEFYLKSISDFEKEFGNDYYRMAEVYFDYGLFLKSTGKGKEALDAHKKSLLICLKNYGEKHTLVSLSYKHIGDDYINLNEFDSALYYYQKSLIAVVNDFNNTDIYSNPSVDSAIFNIRLLDNLKSKARALGMLAGQTPDRELKLKISRKSLETIELAMQLIDRIRDNYPSEESRIYLSENEKETYLFAAQQANNVFNLTKEYPVALLMYNIAQKAKSANLRNEIGENELLYMSGVPDSIRNRENILSGNISAYNNLILEELRNKEPDNGKISLWKDAIFDMNRENEKTVELINSEYPQYHELTLKAEPATLNEIQNNLSKDETIVDYLLSTQVTEGKRKMYIFLITKNSLKFLATGLDSLFETNVKVIREYPLLKQHSVEQAGLFGKYTTALFYMYENLIRPVEDQLDGKKKIIIIPDEEIAWLPFDAFLKSKPSPDQTDFEGLHYLINDYTFSYRYFSSLNAGKEQKYGRGVSVYAFAPGYAEGTSNGKRQEYLQGAESEIEAIFKLFNGKKFTGPTATEANFRESLKSPAIFHLAMHSLSDSSDSRYSYMLFDTGTDSSDDSRLYNYEISISRISSPMVVLSACNSGSGTLYHGEGLMSMARGFILAGASSVIKTSWEVNDETSAAIISRFYFHLSKGKPKDEAMRLAKIEYIKDNPPVYKDPYYWAAYEVLGDNSPVKYNIVTPLRVSVLLILFCAAGGLLYYFKRRRIFSAGSL